MRGWLLLTLVLTACGSSDENNSTQNADAGTDPGSAGVGGTGGARGAPAASGPTPICGEDCSDPRGCYPCGEGQLSSIEGVEHECRGGCWAVDPPETPTCTSFGRGFGDGQNVPDPHGCNECTCAYQEHLGAGAIGCTTVACACDQMPGVEFASTDPAQCADLDFNCPPNTEVVMNHCGCGCSQDPRCATEYDCTGGDCERDVLAAYCPYSTIRD